MAGKDLTLIIFAGEAVTGWEGNVSSFAACYVPGAFPFNPYNNPGTKDCCSLRKVDEGWTSLRGG